jgi:hypothetical protein
VVVGVDFFAGVGGALPHPASARAIAPIPRVRMVFMRVFYRVRIY